MQLERQMIDSSLYQSGRYRFLARTVSMQERLKILS
jgi:hypothetical protein